MKRIMEFKEKGGAIVFVSHDLNAIKLLSDKAMLLDHGQVIEIGDPDSVINSYNFLLAKKSEGQEITVRTSSNKKMSYGNFKVEITAVKMSNPDGQECDIFISGEKCIIQVLLGAREKAPEITVGILIRDKFGQDVFGTNTHYLNIPLSLEIDTSCVVEYIISELNIGPGKYTLTVAAHTRDTHIHECYHWVDVIKSFEVVANREFIFSGLLRLKPEVHVQKYLNNTSVGS
jgi:lipopolysaccharide transport system ATP-binding protein